MQAKVKAKFEQDAAMWLSAHPVEPFPGQVKITIDVLFITQRRRDPHDNYAPKFLFDALVKKEIIKDDNSEIVVDCDVMVFSQCERDGLDVRIEEVL